MVGKAAAFDALASILEYNAGSDRVFMILGVKVGSVHSTGSVRGPTRSHGHHASGLCRRHEENRPPRVGK